MPSLPARSRRRQWISLSIATLLAAATAMAWFWPGRQAAQHARSEKSSCVLTPQAPDAPHPGMVWVPSGTFAFGDTVYPEEQPVRQTRVAGFWIDRTEITNDQFSAFVAATGYVTVAERPVDARLHPGLPPEMAQPGAVVFVMPNATDGSGRVSQWWRYLPGANWRHPGGADTTIAGRGAFAVVAVTIEDALAYARWKGHTVPNEAQWEWAARAAQAQADTEHAQPTQANTWQGLFPVVNSADDGFVGLAPAGCFAANALGVYDLIGNAWELTTDRWTPAHGDSATGGFDAAAPLLRSGAPGQRVIKGGSFLCAPNYCMRYRAGARQPQDDDLGSSHVGFRTVLIAPGP